MTRKKLAVVESEGRSGDRPRLKEKIQTGHRGKQLKPQCAPKYGSGKTSTPKEAIALQFYKRELCESYTSKELGNIVAKAALVGLAGAAVVVVVLWAFVNGF
jgi:hypothetical protein